VLFVVVFRSRRRRVTVSSVAYDATPLYFCRKECAFAAQTMMELLAPITILFTTEMMTATTTNIGDDAAQ